MLPQGCLGVLFFVENNLFPLKVGLRWGFVNGYKAPENSSRSKVGLKVGFGGSLKVGQKYRNLSTFDLLLTYFQGPPETYFRTYLNFPGLWGPLGGQGQHKSMA